MGGHHRYQSMLRAGRALLLADGVLPADGRQHKTVVELLKAIEEKIGYADPRSPYGAERDPTRHVRGVRRQKTSWWSG